MKKILKITGIFILVLLLAIIAIPYFFKDEIVEIITTEVNDNLNASLELGEVSLSLISNFPSLSLTMEEVKLKGVDVFEGISLVEMGEFSATIDLMSVFGDSIRVKSITLKDAKIDVRVLEDGSANYDIAKAVDDTTTTEEVIASESGGFNLKLDEYSLENVDIFYKDAAMPMEMSVVKLNHSGSGDFSDVLYVLQTKTDIESFDFAYDGVRYMNKAAIDITANLEMNMADMKFTFVDNIFKINQLEILAEGWVEMPGDDIDMDFSFSAPSSRLEHLLSMIPAAFASDLDGVEAKGQVAVDGFLRGTYNDTSMPGFGVNLNVDGGQFKYPDLPSSVENIQIRASIDASDGNDYDKMKIDVDRFYMEIANNPVDISLKLRTPMSDPEIDCEMKAQVILDQLKDAVPLEDGDALSGSINVDLGLHGKMSSIDNEDYESFDAAGQIILQKVKYSSDGLAYDMNIDVAYFNFSPAFMELSQFDVTIGETDMSANGKVENYLAYFLRDEKLQGNFNLSSNFMNLNEFMTDTEEASAETETESDPEESYGIFLVPENVDFTLSTSFKKMLYEDIAITNVSGQMAIREGVVDLSGLRMNVLEGTVVMDGSYSTNDPKAPVVDMSFDISNMDIKQAAENFYTIEKMAPLAKSCQGKFSTDLQFSAILDESMEPIEESILGEGSLQTRSVFIEGFKPLNELAKVLKIDRLAKQTIQDVNLSYQIKDGKAIVEPFDVKIDGMKATISGETALLTQEIDYDMSMNIPFEKFPSAVGDKASSLVAQINKAAGTNLSVGDEVPVNLKITGTVDSPKITTNYGDVAKGEVQDVIEQVKEQIEEKIEEVKEDAVAIAREAADKILADAKRESDKLMADAQKAADKAKAEAYKHADDIANNGGNPLEKLANRKAADVMRKAADKAHVRAMDKAREQADKLLSVARKSADDKINSVE